MKIENCLKDALDSFYQREFDETVPETAYDDPRRILIAESNPEDHEEIQVRAYANLEDMTIDMCVNDFIVERTWKFIDQAAVADCVDKSDYQTMTELNTEYFILYQMNNWPEQSALTIKRMMNPLADLTEFNIMDPDKGAAEDKYFTAWAGDINMLADECDSDDPDDMTICNAAYDVFNQRHPEGYSSRSMSIGDILAIVRFGSPVKYYLCDVCGFTEIKSRKPRTMYGS